MNIIRIGIVALAVLFMTFGQEAQAQDADQVAAERLQELVGDWTYANGGGASCSMMGDYIVQCLTTGVNDAGDEVNQAFFTRYDAVEDVYWSYLFYNNGSAYVGRGWVDGNDWTFVYDDRGDVRYRFSGTASDDNWTFTWHRSDKGGEWQEYGGGSMTRN